MQPIDRVRLRDRAGIAAGSVARPDRAGRQIGVRQRASVGGPGGLGGIHNDAPGGASQGRNLPDVPEAGLLQPRVGDSRSVGGPARVRFDDRVVRDAHQAAARGEPHPEVVEAVAVGDEGDGAAVGGKRRLGLHAREIGDGTNRIGTRSPGSEPGDDQTAPTAPIARPRIRPGRSSRREAWSFGAGAASGGAAQLLLRSRSAHRRCPAAASTDPSRGSGAAALESPPASSGGRAPSPARS